MKYRNIRKSKAFERSGRSLLVVFSSRVFVENTRLNLTLGEPDREKKVGRSLQRLPSLIKPKQRGS